MVLLSLIGEGQPPKLLNKTDIILAFEDNINVSILCVMLSQLDT